MAEKRKTYDPRSFERLLEKQTGKAVRPYRADSYVNLLNKYGTSQDTTEHYQYQAEPPVPDEMLTAYYEGNGLFAKIIDTPAEEAVKHGFTLDIQDQEIENFYVSGLDELDWEETVMTAIKWARLFGGSIIVMLIDDGRGLEEPVDWEHIRSIDELRVYDRSVIQEDQSGMYNYTSQDPFRTRSSHFGMPEYYDVFSRYGTFRVHESRCLVFQNGILPENTTNGTYQFWGMPEYVRINKAIRDAEVAHGSATKLLDRSVQAVYKMKDLASELATEEGEDRVLRRLQTIDMARGMLNSITIDADGEDYDFRTFAFSGVSDVIDSTCNYLSALTNIPQTILFGRSPAGMNSTGEADLENWYNFLERIQRRMVKKNLRYLLSVMFQAGVASGEIDEVPDINIHFNSLWSVSETEQAGIDATRAATEQTRAQTAQIYMDAQVIDPSEVRKKLADSEEFDIENMLDDYDDDDLFANMPQGEEEEEEMPLEEPEAPEEAAPTEPAEESEEGEGPAEKPDEEPEEEPEEKEKEDSRADSVPRSVGVLVVKNGCILSGVRMEGFETGQFCGPGGHVEESETFEDAAVRETQEEFGITPENMIQIGYGPWEPDTGLKPAIFLTTEYEGELQNTDGEIGDIRFRSMEELNELNKLLFRPFKESLDVLQEILSDQRNDGADGDSGEEMEEARGAVSTSELRKQFWEAGSKSDTELNEDGAPMGNQNAAGPHKRDHLSAKEKRKYANRLIGQTTSNGVKVKGISRHAYDRIAQRNISVGRIERMIQTGTVSPSKEFPKTRSCYDVPGSRMVLGNKDGRIITVEWRDQ